MFLLYEMNRYIKIKEQSVQWNVFVKKI